LVFVKPASKEEYSIELEITIGHWSVYNIVEWSTPLAGECAKDGQSVFMLGRDV